MVSRKDNDKGEERHRVDRSRLYYDFNNRVVGVPNSSISGFARHSMHRDDPRNNEQGCHEASGY